MKKILTAVLCLAVPGLLFLNAWQGYRFNALSDQVAALEKQQKDLLEANRDIIGQIAFESSPDRVAAESRRPRPCARRPVCRGQAPGRAGARPEDPSGDGHASKRKAIESFSALVAGSGGAAVARPLHDAGIDVGGGRFARGVPGSLFVALPGRAHRRARVPPPGRRERRGRAARF